MKQMSFVAAVREYFGFKPGQTPMEFMQEIKALTPDDRVYLANEFRKVGYDISPVVV